MAPAKVFQVTPKAEKEKWEREQAAWRAKYAKVKQYVKGPQVLWIKSALKKPRAIADAEEKGHYKSHKWYNKNIKRHDISSKWQKLDAMGIHPEDDEDIDVKMLAGDRVEP